MVEGLDKIAEILGETLQSTKDGPERSSMRQNKSQIMNIDNASPTEQDTYTHLPAIDIDLFDPSSFSFGDPNLGLGMPFFDFEGMNFALDLGFAQ